MRDLKGVGGVEGVEGGIRVGVGGCGGGDGVGWGELQVWGGMVQ